MLNDKKGLKNNNCHETIGEYDDTILKGFSRGFIKIIVLWVLTKQRSHGYEIMSNLHTKCKNNCNDNGNSINKNVKSENKSAKQRDIAPGPNRIYPILHELEKKDLIEGTWGTQGKRRIKYYEATQKGHNTIARLKLNFEHEAPDFVKEFWHDVIGKKSGNDFNK